MSRIRIGLWGYGYYGKKTENNLRRKYEDTIEITAIADKMFSKSTDGYHINTEEVEKYYHAGHFDAVMITVLDKVDYSEIEMFLKKRDIPIYTMKNKDFGYIRDGFIDNHKWNDADLAFQGYHAVFSKPLFARIIDFFHGYGIDIMLYDEERVYLDSRPITCGNIALLNYTDDLATSKENCDLILDECVVFNWYNSLNYCHFTMEVFDKVFVMEKNGYQGKYLLPDAKYSRELIALLGLADERVFWISKKEENTQFFIKKPIIVYVDGSYDFGRNKYNAMVCIEWEKEIRRSLDEEINRNEYPKYLYIKRTGHRALIYNEEQIAILKEFGFEEFLPEKYTVKQQMCFFRSAQIVISPHGANSMNCLYMKEGAVVIETCSPLFVASTIIEICHLKHLHYLQMTASDTELIDDGTYSESSNLKSYHIYTTLMKCMIDNAFLLLNNSDKNAMDKQST